MGSMTQMLYCQTCKRKTVHLSTKPSHVLHLLLSLLTLGLWLIVWVLAGLASQKPTCTECGTKVGSFTFHR